ncbi:MAG: CRISPR-associated protein Cas4 [Thermoprotei archaeon]
MSITSSYRSSEVIIPILYKHYMKEELERLDEAKDPRVIYVTDLVACTHKFKLRKIYPELTFRFEPAAIIGNLIHEGLGQILVSEGYDIEYSIEEEFEIDGQKYIIKGRVDAYHKDKGIVVEIKSGRDTSNKPLPHHIQQLQVYLNILNANTGILVYITPEGFLEYSINKEKMNIKSMVRALVRDEIHPKWEWECRYCIFRKICSYSLVQRRTSNTS